MKRLTSWVDSANAAETHFPLNNLPFGVFQRDGGPGTCCIAIGDRVLDLCELEACGLIAPSDHAIFDEPCLNRFMALGKPAWQALRARLQELLSADGDDRLSSDKELCAHVLLAQVDVHMLMPFRVAEYTDFYAGRQHATNVGTMFRGAENALPPNWLHMPIGYNGRASSVVVSGTDIHRPLGQRKPPDVEMPVFGASRRLDFELEMGAVVGAPSRFGMPITTRQADDMIFGYVLLNDWSSRDIQGWEYQPLGPFQGKAFGTSISPWIVTSDALEPFRRPTPPREKELLPYLAEHRPGLYDITLEVLLQPEGAAEPTRITRTNYSRMYYSAAQQLAHHAISGCPMNTGDLLGSGTISGPIRDEYGSLLELSWGGKTPLTLDTGETRTFLEDGDRVTFVGYAQGEDYRVGFGACTGCILPAVDELEW